MISGSKSNSGNNLTVCRFIAFERANAQKLTDAGLSGDRYSPARLCPAFGPAIG